MIRSPWFAFALVACSSGTGVAVPTAADVDRVSVRWPATTLAELTRGRNVYLARCGACHGWVAPGSLPAQEWSEVVQRMRVRARLDDAQAEALVRYLVGVATRQKETTPNSLIHDTNKD